MRTIAASLAVLLLATSSMALAQDRQGGGPGGPSIGAGAGPSIGGGGGDGPRGAGPGAGGGGGYEGPSGGAERGGGGPAGEALRGDGAPGERSGPSSAERGPQDDGPSERRASKRDDGPSKAERKASDDTKSENSEKRARTADDNDSKPSRKAERTTDKSEKSDKAEAKKEKADAKADDARDAKQSEANRSTGKDDNKRADTKPSGDKPAKHVDLTGPKRDNVRSAFGREKDFKRHDRSGIHVSVGRRLPRDWDYRPVPIAVIEIVPEYRDYVFVYAEDEYVICDPDTYEVVAVVPAGGGATYAGGSGGSDRCPARLSLSRDERELILDEVRMNDEVDVRDLEVGWSVPSNVELQRFPDEVLSKADELDGCRYFVAKDQLAIVDPIEEKVVLVIDKG